jgi:tRNA threonylcarbamoyladenosine biosynthesis protein TsaB
MKLIAWDTSSKTGALAALEWEPSGQPSTAAGVRLVCEWTLNLDSAQHSERLMWSIDKMLEAAGWRLKDIDVFGVGVGPGSFTGLRIGITTARTLAHTLGKPLVGVSSLAALARPVASWISDPSTLVVAATDACKGELFALWGKAAQVAGSSCAPGEQGSGLWGNGVQEKVLTPKELMVQIEQQLEPGQKWVAVGEGTRRYLSAWAQLPEAQRLTVPVPFSEGVQGRTLALLAWEAWQSGISTPALSVQPRYLRASDAEIKLKAGLLPQGPTRGV